MTVRAEARRLAASGLMTERELKMNKVTIGGGGLRLKPILAAAAVAMLLAAPQGAWAKPPRVTPQETANIQTINSFIAAWNAKDAAKVMSFFASDARFTVGDIGKTPAFQKPDFAGMIQGAVSIKMTIQPGTIWARGPVVTHERVDNIVLGPDSRIAGRYIAVFTLRDGKIVDFTDYILENDSSPQFR